MIVNRIKQLPSIMTSQLDFTIMRLIMIKLSTVVKSVERDTWHKFQMKEFSPQTSPDPITRPIQFNMVHEKTKLDNIAFFSLTKKK